MSPLRWCQRGATTAYTARDRTHRSGRTVPAAGQLHGTASPAWGAHKDFDLRCLEPGRLRLVRLLQSIHPTATRLDRSSCCTRDRRRARHRRLSPHEGSQLEVGLPAAVAGHPLLFGSSPIGMRTIVGPTSDLDRNESLDRPSCRSASQGCDTGGECLLRRAHHQSRLGSYSPRHRMKFRCHRGSCTHLRRPS